MRFRDLLNEKFKTAFNDYGNYIEVFENPTQKEIKNLIKNTLRNGTLRLGIEDKKNPKLYVWDAESLHYDTKRKAKIRFDIGLVYEPHKPIKMMVFDYTIDEWQKEIKNKKEVIKTLLKYFPKIKIVIFDNSKTISIDELIQDKNE